MSMNNVFEGKAFKLTSLTAAIEKTQYKPGMLSSMRLFSEKGETTTVVNIERNNKQLSLVPIQPRGSEKNNVDGDKRDMIPFNIIHLPQSATIMADEVQDVRAFGDETNEQMVQAVINDRLAKMRGNLDVTIEFHRAKALQGLLVDADGSVVMDLNAQFGFAQSDTNLALSNAATKVKQAIIQKIARPIKKALGRVSFTGISCACSPAFFDLITGHEKTEKAFERQQDGGFLREDQRSAGFYFAGVFFFEYDGYVGSTPYIPDGEAYAFATGVSELFITRFGPAPYSETVNTIGRPYYAKSERMRFDVGTELQGQSNPLNLCTRPDSIIKLVG